MAIAFLETENLSKFFNGLKALDRVSLEAKRDLITLIIGPNGGGKTTLINTISGYYKSDGGKVRLEGNDITNKPPYEIYKLGIVRTFQIPQPLKKLTVLENLMMAEHNPGEGLIGSLNKTWQKVESELSERAFKYLEFLKIDHLWNVESHKLSGGQLKLLEVGRALMRNAKIIIMDEPIAGVNPTLAHSILERLVEIKKIEIAFLLVEHRLDIILKYVDYIYVMASGSLIAEGVEHEILQNPDVMEVYLSAERQKS